MYFEIVTNTNKIRTEVVKIEDLTIYYKVNISDEKWLSVPEGTVRYIGINGHLRDYV